MSDTSSSDRRPLKTRSWRVFQVTAAGLARAGVSPNLISVASIVSAVVGAAGFVATGLTENDLLRRMSWLVALIGIQGRLIANLLDGMVAVEGGRGSAVGPLYNEVPDRVSDPILLIAAGYAFSGDPLAGWAATAVALFVAYVRAIGASVGAGQLFLGPMAKQQRMALLSGACLVGAILPSAWLRSSQAGMMQLVLWIMVAGGLVTAARRLRRTASYLKANAGSEAEP